MDERKNVSADTFKPLSTFNQKSAFRQGRAFSVGVYRAKRMFGWIGTIVGILLLLFAAFMIFFFPATTVHQIESFGWNGVLIGFIAGIIGVALLFL